jgi:Na+/melibiose symporter-like transporter
MRVPTARSDDREVSTGRVVAYALPGFATSLAAVPLALFVPAFYGRDLGLPLATVGLAIAASRIFDVVTDPMVGWMSDRGMLPGGRRKPWIVVGVPVLLLGLWQLFVPPPEAGHRYLFAWAAVFFLGSTLVELPYRAWGSELSSSYDGRSRITGWREAMGVLGQVTLLLGLVGLGAQGLTGSAEQLRAVAIGVAVLLPLCTIVAVSVAPEGPDESLTGDRLPTARALHLILRNPAFLRMLGVVSFFVSGVVMQGTLHRIILADVIGAEDRFAAMLLAENLATLAAIPLWLYAGKRFGKHRALAGAALWLAAWSLPLLALGPGDVTSFVAVIAIRGSSFGAILLLSNSLAADVIDVDTLASGRQRSGVYFAVWGMTTKAAVGLGVVLGTGLAAFAGYDTEALPLSPDALQRLLWVYGGVPAALMTLGALFLWSFPITRDSHRDVRRQIEAFGTAESSATSSLGPPA